MNQKAYYVKVTRGDMVEYVYRLFDEHGGEDDQIGLDQNANHALPMTEADAQAVHALFASKTSYVAQILTQYPGPAMKETPAVKKAMQRLRSGDRIISGGLLRNGHWERDSKIVPPAFISDLQKMRAIRGFSEKVPGMSYPNNGYQLDCLSDWEQRRMKDTERGIKAAWDKFAADVGAMRMFTENITAGLRNNDGDIKSQVAFVLKLIRLRSLESQSTPWAVKPHCRMPDGFGHVVEEYERIVKDYAYQT